ncbi:MAG: alpha/beta fold hydrolase [Simkania sp.]|nr:alpha/beta fold hydrolase [Simkania sp.]
MPRILFLHGFLGSPNDWDAVIHALPKSYHCTAINVTKELPLYSCPTKAQALQDDLVENRTRLRKIRECERGCPEVKDLEENTLYLPKPVIDASCYVVGYSMGGRIALQFFGTHRLVLIGAHLGLSDDTQRQKRLLIEQQWIHHLTTDPEKFIDDWYDQPLFSSLRQNPSLFATLLKRRKSIDISAHIALLKHFSLSHQICYKPPEGALFLFGEKDKQYASLYDNLTNARAIPKAGHAAHIENPNATALCIQNYIEETSC